MELSDGLFRGIGEAYGNADGLVPRTMEIWQTYGMLEPFEAKGNPMIGMVRSSDSYVLNLLIQN